MKNLNCKEILKNAICLPYCIFENEKIQKDCISCKYKNTNSYYIKNEKIKRKRIDRIR